MSFTTTLSASANVVDVADVLPSTIFNSVTVDVIPSSAFISAAVAVTPSSILSSAVVDVTPSRRFNSAAVDVTPSSMLSSAAVDVIAVPLKLIASACTVPSKYPSLNSKELVPKSISLSVTGTRAPSAMYNCWTELLDTST